MSDQPPPPTSSPTPPEGPSPSGVLRSNIDTHQAPAEVAGARGRGSPLALLLVALVTFIAGIGITLVFLAPKSATPSPSAAASQNAQAGGSQSGGAPNSSGGVQGGGGGPQSGGGSLSGATQGTGGAQGASSSQPQAAPGQATNPNQAGAQPRRPATQPVGAPFPDINGIRCDALESTIFHIHVHLAVFFDSEEQQIPFGIGIGQPWQVSDSDEGPFVDDGSCFYWMHTHTEDGIIHIESPVRRPFTLGDFFAVWQQPLSATQVGPRTGQVIVYVNGQRDSSTSPEDIRLLAHQRIQLDVGADVPPYQFDFPDGD